ncbi:hypothetical protein T265_02331 [Opisthorchis viverrini]|uniref:Uncharacterized protein n=1 Tax=Opisthorchis viverrini TaxID=6198 RepID=A0A074ZWA8_OPIVI|nr:hypothetical protein T265_02331 [Opisthorchis viverrini]KER31421.1 hypothetical protein T265_02331 [Opisthorchis viverrini]
MVMNDTLTMCTRLGTKRLQTNCQARRTDQLPPDQPTSLHARPRLCLRPTQLLDAPENRLKTLKQVLSMTCIQDGDVLRAPLQPDHDEHI